MQKVEGSNPFIGEQHPSLGRYEDHRTELATCVATTAASMTARIACQRERALDHRYGLPVDLRRHPAGETELAQVPEQPEAGVGCG
jgi:hypothetical protein